MNINDVKIIGVGKDEHSDHLNGMIEGKFYLGLLIHLIIVILFGKFLVQLKEVLTF